jgi:hypothetical protein
LLVLIKKISRLLIFSNVVVSAATGFLTLGFCKQLELNHTFEYALFVFFSTLFTYNLQRYIKSFQYKTASTIHMKWVLEKRKELLYFLVFAFIGSAFFGIPLLINLPIKSLFILGISGLISFFYIQKVKNYNLRTIPQLKIHLIALIWAIAVVLFPAINEGKTLNEVFIYAILVYAYIIGITIPFDIRDLKYDDPSYYTIPQLIGVRNSKVLSIVLLFIFFYFSIYLFPNLLTKPFFYLAMSYSILLVAFVNKKRSDYYYSGWIESSIILVGLGMC